MIYLWTEQRTEYEEKNLKFAYIHLGKGLLDNYLVSISHRTNIGKSGNDTDDLTFNLENFKIKKEVKKKKFIKIIPINCTSLEFTAFIILTFYSFEV